MSIKIASETEPLGVTPEHPFYVRVHGARSNLSSEDDGEWKAAQNLEDGDELTAKNYKVIPLEFTWHTRLGGAFRCATSPIYRESRS